MPTVELPPKTVTRQREDELRSEERSADATGYRGPALVFTTLSFLLLMMSGFMAFGIGVNSVAQALVFGACLAMGMGGLLNHLSGSAKLSYKKLITASGGLAVVLFVFLMILGAFGFLSTDDTHNSSELKPITPIQFPPASQTP